MQQFFDADGVNVGDNHAIAGTMDGVAYNLWGMKEPDYVMRMMAMGGALAVYETCKEALRKWMEGGIEVVCRFRYACPFDWHFRYRHAVDDHNNLHHALPSVEDSWVTHRWEIRVFSFVLAISEVNAFLALRYFTFAKGTIPGCPSLIVFRSEGISSVHMLMTAPNHAKLYRNRQWTCTTRARFQQYMCTHGCGKKIGTYCTCTPGRWVCCQCFPDHVQSLDAEA